LSYEPVQHACEVSRERQNADGLHWVQVADSMKQFGVQVINALMTDMQPDETVMRAMNKYVCVRARSLRSHPSTSASTYARTHRIQCTHSSYGCTCVCVRAHAHCTRSYVLDVAERVFASLRKPPYSVFASSTTNHMLS